MVAGIITLEVESPVEPKRLWNALVKDGHNILPKYAPEFCSGVTIIQGNGGVGTIKQINFTPVNKDFSYVKERVDEVDEGNMVYSYSHVEGGELGKKVSSAKFQLKFCPKPSGGSVSTWTCKYDSLPGVPEDQAKIEEMKTQHTAIQKKIEAVLIANPTLYC